MEGATIDMNMADKWLANQDQICPRVIADDGSEAENYDDEEEEDDDQE